MDADTVSATHSHEKLLARFEREKIPILVGTQMVAKGLDFENVTLVGVAAADFSLYVDDYRAAERTFSLLTQVVGRAGRGEKAGRAIIQTYTPENEVILAAARQDYDAFYEQELPLRRLRGLSALPGSGGAHRLRTGGERGAAHLCAPAPHAGELAFPVRQPGGPASGARSGGRG